MNQVKIQGHTLELTKSGAIRKELALNMWNRLQPVKLQPDPIMYKHKGTTVDQDGVRICGSPEFIGAVLARLKDLLKFEGDETRIGISFSELSDRETGSRIKGRFRCSVQVHERGDESKMLNIRYGRI